MPKFVGGAAALVALLAGIFAKVDPMVTLGRASLAFLLGLICGQVWHVLFTYGGRPLEAALLDGQGTSPAKPIGSEETRGN